MITVRQKQALLAPSLPKLVYLVKKKGTEVPFIENFDT
jgi:hypothetical protein